MILVRNLEHQNDATDRNYLEHVGGYHAEEINDINLYSQHSLLRPAGNTNHLGGYIGGSINNNNLPPSEDNNSQHQRRDDDLLLVTTL